MKKPNKDRVIEIYQELYEMIEPNGVRGICSYLILLSIDNKITNSERRYIAEDMEHFINSPLNRIHRTTNPIYTAFFWPQFDNQSRKEFIMGRLEVLQNPPNLIEKVKRYITWLIRNI